MIEDDDYDALSQKQLASIKRDMRITLEDAAVRATHKVVADLTEKNLEDVLVNMTTSDKPITIKPTTWFGNPAKTAQWYTCPNCAKQSPLTLEWVGLTDDEIKEIVGPYGDTPIKGYTRKLFDQIEDKLRSKNT